MSHEGRGIAYVAGKTVFIDNALPEEEVDFIYTQRKSKYCTGIAVNIVRPSKLRVSPFCDHYANCGGCSLQHLQHDDQLDFKSAMLLEQLGHLGNSNLGCISRRITGLTTHYRRRARLAVKYSEKKEELLIGFHERQGGYINRIESCAILHATVGKKIIELKQLIRSLTIHQYIAQIEVACGSTLAAIVLRNLLPLAQKDVQLLEEFSRKHQIEIYSQSDGIESVKLIAGSGKPLSYDLDNCSIKMFFTPTDFIQINQQINEQLVNVVVELLELQRNDTVLDLFCGIGNFTLPIAKRVKQVIGVEGMATAVVRAQQNALHNGLTNIAFHAADLEKNFQEQSWWQNIYDKIVLDPPRTGAEKLCANLKKLQAKKIIYVSCNAATLARDVGILQNNGYQLLTVSIADMYPHTKHLEIVAELCLLRHCEE